MRSRQGTIACWSMPPAPRRELSDATRQASSHLFLAFPSPSQNQMTRDGDSSLVDQSASKPFPPRFRHTHFGTSPPGRRRSPLSARKRVNCVPVVKPIPHSAARQTGTRMSLCHRGGRRPDCALTPIEKGAWSARGRDDGDVDTRPRLESRGSAGATRGCSSFDPSRAPHSREAGAGLIRSSDPTGGRRRHTKFSGRSLLRSSRC